MSFARFVRISAVDRTQKHYVHILQLVPRQTMDPGEKNIATWVLRIVLYRMVGNKRPGSYGRGIYRACGAGHRIIDPQGGWQADSHMHGSTRVDWGPIWLISGSRVWRRSAAAATPGVEVPGRR